jgi:hypothetical protein
MKNRSEEKRLVTHEILCKSAWGQPALKKLGIDILRYRLHTEVKKLRDKLGDNGKRPRIIGGIRPHGYRFLLEEVAVKGLYGKRTTGSLGPASSVFLHPGLLTRVVGTVMTVHQGMIVPSLQGIDGIEAQVAFVHTEELVELSGRINAQAFRRQMWRGTGVGQPLNIREKVLRNRGHCQKNPYCILLIRSFPIQSFTPTKPYIGLSHVIPLNARGYDRYRAGRIEDNKFNDPNDICGLGENVRALVLFSIAADTQTLRQAYAGMPQEFNSSGEFKYQVGMSLVRSLAYHVQRMLEHYDSPGGGMPIELLAQNDGAEDIINVLKSAEFARTKYISGDKFPIWKALCRRDAGKPRREFSAVDWGLKAI